jgi:hypothetical protein
LIDGLEVMDLVELAGWDDDENRLELGFPDSRFCQKGLCSMDESETCGITRELD